MKREDGMQRNLISCVQVPSQSLRQIGFQGRRLLVGLCVRHFHGSVNRGVGWGCLVVLRRPENGPPGIPLHKACCAGSAPWSPDLEHALTSWLQEISVFAKKQHSQKEDGKNRHKRAHHLDPIDQHVVA